VFLIGTDGDETATTAEIGDPVAGTWTAIEPMNKLRSDYVAVALANDRVLVAGGLNGDAPQSSYSSAYVYDASPGYGAWTKVGPMGLARTGASAALLPDGRVLVAGGYFHVEPKSMNLGAPLADLAAYHPLSPTGDPRLFDVEPPFGGAALATAEIFDPATGSWSTTGPMKYARYGATAVSLSDGRVLIVGSSDTTRGGYLVGVDGHAFDTAEVYDPAGGTFKLVSRLPDFDRAALQKLAAPGADPLPADSAPLTGGTLVPTRDGGAVLIGATRYWKHLADMTQSFRFDAATGNWTEIGQTYVFVGEPGPVPFWTPGAPNLNGAIVASLTDGRVLVAGGQGPNEYGQTGFNETKTTDVAQFYDPASNTWSAAPPMPGPQSGGAAVALTDGSVLLVGGPNNSAARFVP
jgi:hypothetical protein